MAAPHGPPGLGGSQRPGEVALDMGLLGVVLLDSDPPPLPQKGKQYNEINEIHEINLINK